MKWEESTKRLGLAVQWVCREEKGGVSLCTVKGKGENGVVLRKGRKSPEGKGDNEKRGENGIQ
jgi:hypothetical protein